MEYVRLFTLRSRLVEVVSVVGASEKPEFDTTMRSESNFLSSPSANGFTPNVWP